MRSLKPARRRLVVGVVAVAAMTLSLGTVTTGAQAATDPALQIIQNATGSTATPVTAPITVQGVAVKPATVAGRATGTYYQSSSSGVVNVFGVLNPGQSIVQYHGVLKPDEHLEPGDWYVFPEGDVPGAYAIVNSLGKVTGYLGQPWAEDANGTPLNTYFRSAIGTGNLDQWVDTTGAVFPIVADPSIRIGTYWGIPVYRVQFTWTETTRLYRKIDNGATMVAALCGYVGAKNALAGGVCLAAGSMYWNSLKNTIVSAVNHKKCLKLRLPISWGAATFWVYDPYTVKCSS